MKEPEFVTATQEELDELLTLARTSFPTKQYELLEGVLATFVYVMLKLQNAKTSIKRFQRMLFGGRTEHKRNVLERAAIGSDPHGQDAACPGAEQAEVAAAAPKPRPREHGRNAAQAYSGAPIVECAHPDLAAGDRCPTRHSGRSSPRPRPRPARCLRN